MNELRQRQPRMVDEGFLAFLRKQRCAFCGRWPGDRFNPIQAAHLRMACPVLGKRYTGKQEKPDDRWATPLCSWCHLDGPSAQHKIGEQNFWGLAEINPFFLAMDLYTQYGGDGGKPRRRKSIIKPRLAKGIRRIIMRGKRSWPKRKLRSRGF